MHKSRAFKVELVNKVEKTQSEKAKTHISVSHSKRDRCRGSHSQPNTFHYKKAHHLVQQWTSFNVHGGKDQCPKCGYFYLTPNRMFSKNAVVGVRVERTTSYNVNGGNNQCPKCEYFYLTLERMFSQNAVVGVRVERAMDVCERRVV